MLKTEVRSSLYILLCIGLLLFWEEEFLFHVLLKFKFYFKFVIKRALVLTSEQHLSFEEERCLCQRPPPKAWHGHDFIFG